MSDSLLDKLGIGDVEIVADDLNEPAELGGLRLKGRPIVLVKPSSIETIGNRLTQSEYRDCRAPLVKAPTLDLAKLYEPLLQNEEAAGSRAIAICSPGT